MIVICEWCGTPHDDTKPGAVGTCTARPSGYIAARSFCNADCHQAFERKENVASQFDTGHGLERSMTRLEKELRQ